ncbi:hypothetical protein ACJX0J_033755, partial [Zea mays]
MFLNIVTTGQTKSFSINFLIFKFNKIGFMNFGQPVYIIILYCFLKCDDINAVLHTSTQVLFSICIMISGNVHQVVFVEYMTAVLNIFSLSFSDLDFDNLEDGEETLGLYLYVYVFLILGRGLLREKNNIIHILEFPFLLINIGMFTLVGVL